MRYRELSPTGDYVFGHSQDDMWVDAAEGVAQSVLTRLLLTVGDWFLDTTEGTDWSSIIGKSNQETRDAILRQRILDTPHVSSLDEYASSVDPTSRKMVVSASITTEFGPADLTHTFSLSGGTVPRGTVSSGGTTIIVQGNLVNFGDEVPTGAVDGVNPTFLLTRTPSPASSLKLYIDSGPGTSLILLRQGPGEAYTIASNIIAMTVAPPVGSRLFASYRY